MTIDLRAELYYDGAWNTITGDVDMRSAVTVKFGQPDEHGDSVPTDVTATLDNTGQDYSPKDPQSALYGKVGLNTLARFRVGDPQAALSLPGLSGSYASTPDAAALDITGDLDVRAELTPDTWHPPATTVIAAKWRFATSEIAWALHLTDGGHVELSWSPDGTLGNRIVVPATDVVYDENLILNPCAGLSAADWVTNKTLTRVTGLLDLGFERDTGGTITGDGSGEDFIVPSSGDAVAGRVYSGAASLAVSQDATVEVYLLFLDSGLSVLSSPSTGTVAVTAGGVVRLSVEAETAPANTEHIAMQVSIVNSTADLTVSACRVQRGSTADPYGDGTDTGWGWSGAEHDSSSGEVRGVRRAVRATLDVNNGASGRTVTFYTSDSIDGSWTQLGETVTTAGTTSVDSNDSDLTIGAVHGGGASFSDITTYRGLVHAFEVRDGIGGTVVADPDFTGQGTDTSGFDDTAGRTWSLNELGHIADPSLRASIAVSSWTPTWDETTYDAQTRVRGSGFLQRLENDDAIGSALRRALLSETISTLVAYWPCEDEEGSTSIASALPGAPPMHIAVGSPDFAANSDFVASDPLPHPQDSYWVGTVPTYTPGVASQVRWLLSIPDAGVGEQSLIAIRTSGSIGTWLVVVSAGGSMSLRAFDRSGTSVFDSGAFAFDMNGNPKMVSVEFGDDGTDTYCNLVTLAPGAASGNHIGVETISDETVGIVTEVQMGSIGDCGVGHVSVHSEVDSIFTLGTQLAAWAGETAGERIKRLCEEEGVPFTATGDLSATPAMGPQGSGALLELIREAQETDLGILGEQRDRFGLRYLARNARYNRAPVITLDMHSGHVTNPFEPPLDDQGTVNDITVKRSGGSSARAVQTSGPRNVSSPQDDPQGVGRHPSTITLNLDSDDQLGDQAGWRLHLGTVDEHRVATLEVEVEHHTDLQQPLLELQQGDVIRVLNPPPGLPPGPLDLVVLGWSDRFTTQTWRVVFNLAPAEPWNVIRLGDGVSKLNSGTSTLDTAIDADDTSLSVAVASGRLWTTDAGQMPIPITIGGEGMSVTAISGSSSPQTFTVVRSTNGIVKSHSAGAAVGLARRATLAL